MNHFQGLSCWWEPSMERASVKCTQRCTFGMGGLWYEVAQL